MNAGLQVFTSWVRVLAGAAALAALSAPALAAATQQGAGGDVQQQTDAVVTLGSPPAGGGAWIVSLGLPGWPTSQGDLLAPFLRDATLRPGDVVATSTGLMVFEGRRKGEHLLTDFKPLAGARLVTNAGRAELEAMERTMRATPSNIIMVAYMEPRASSAVRLGRAGDRSVVALGLRPANGGPDGRLATR